MATKQSSTEQQVLEFYVTSTGGYFQTKRVMENGWVHDQNNQHRKSKESPKVALATIANKWGVTKTDHIQGYTPSEKFIRLKRLNISIPEPWADITDRILIYYLGSKKTHVLIS